VHGVAPQIHPDLLAILAHSGRTNLIPMMIQHHGSRSISAYASVIRRSALRKSCAISPSPSLRNAQRIADYAEGNDAAKKYLAEGQGLVFWRRRINLIWYVRAVPMRIGA